MFGGIGVDNKIIFAQNLKKYMQINNKTRKDVCNALGYSYYTFSDWVNGKKYPRMDKVEQLANYFGIQKSDLIEEKEEVLEQPTITQIDGLSDGQRKLIEFVKTVPEDKLDMIFRVMKSIAESD